MKKILLGESVTGELVHMDVESLVETRLLVSANSGGGKSWAVRRLLEQTHGQIQQIVIDREDEFYTLREKFDYILAGREGGECAVDPRSAPLLARRILELGVSAILSLYDLKPHDRARFVRAFLDALINAPKALWHPCLVVVDEAHTFCPERGHGEAESSEAVISLMSQGRKRGFCGVLATQRLSKLNKDAVAEANNRLIGRCAMDVDMKRASYELGFSAKEDQLRLRDLEPGAFFGFGPSISKLVCEVRFGGVKTSHPKAGQRAAPAPVARDKVKKILSKLADLPKEAEEEVRDLTTARRRIMELERAQKFSPVLSETAVDKAYERGFSAGKAEGISESVAVIQLANKNMKKQGQLLAQIGKLANVEISEGIPVPLRFGPAPHTLGENLQVVAVGRPFIREIPADKIPKEKRVYDSRAYQNGGGPDLTGPEQKILDALAWMESIGVDEPEQTAVAFLAGYTVGGGAWNNPRGALRTKGFIEYKGDKLKLTDEGRAHAKTPAGALNTAALHEKVLERLPGPEQKLLKVLLEAYPIPMSNEALAEASGYAVGGGAYANPRGRLKSLGLIQYRSEGIVAQDLLFLNQERKA